MEHPETFNDDIVQYILADGVSNKLHIQYRASKRIQIVHITPQRYIIG